MMRMVTLNPLANRIQQCPTPFSERIISLTFSLTLWHNFRNWVYI